MRLRRVKPGDLASLMGEWDFLISGWNENSRTAHVRQCAIDLPGLLLVQPEYGLPRPVNTAKAQVIDVEVGDELEAMGSVVAQVVEQNASRLLVDITGLLSHNLLALVRRLAASSLATVTFCYAAPGRYNRDSATEFATAATEVRQVFGYEGMPEVGAEQRDRLIIGLGYDHHLVHRLCDSMPHAEKRVIFALPALQPDMYVDSWLRTLLVEEEIGPAALNDPAFTPANDPFATAAIVSKAVRQAKEAGTQNVYLCPLGPRPTVLGFGIFFVAEALDTTVSCLLPFAREHRPNTSEGLASVSLFDVDLDYVRTLSELGNVKPVSNEPNCTD